MRTNPVESGQTRPARPEAGSRPMTHGLPYPWSAATTHGHLTRESGQGCRLTPRPHMTTQHASPTTAPSACHCP
jgi:hypothetical protein